MKCWCLLLKFYSLLFQYRDREEMIPSIHNSSKVYRLTKYRFLQFCCICFATLPLVVDCELFYQVHLPGFGSSLVPRTQILGDMWQLWVVGWAMSPIKTPFGQQGQIPLLRPFVPPKGWFNSWLLPEVVELKDSYARVNCWLRHVVFIDCTLSQLSNNCLSSSWIGQLRCDCRNLKIEFEFHFRNWLFATRKGYSLVIRCSVLKLTFEKQLTKLNCN